MRSHFGKLTEKTVATPVKLRGRLLIGFTQNLQKVSFLSGDSTIHIIVPVTLVFKSKSYTFFFFNSFTWLVCSSRFRVDLTEHCRLSAPALLGRCEDWSAFQNNRWNLGLLCVLSICEVCFYQRFKATVSSLTQVEHKDKEKHQETNEDSPQSGA